MKVNDTGNPDAGEEFAISKTDVGGSGSPDCSPFCDLPPVYWRLIATCDHERVVCTREYVLMLDRRRPGEMGNYLISVAWR